MNAIDDVKANSDRPQCEERPITSIGSAIGPRSGHLATRDEIVAALTRATLGSLHDVARALAAELQRIDAADPTIAPVVSISAHRR